MLSFGWLTAPRLRRRVGVDMGGNATCLRGGCAHAQTQSCSAQTLAHMPAAAWCDYMRQAWKKARRRRVEQLVEAERTCARSKECSHLCLVLCDKTMLAHAGGDR
jgi:hypothetical protein